MVHYLFVNGPATRTYTGLDNINLLDIVFSSELSMNNETRPDSDHMKGGSTTFSGWSKSPGHGSTQGCPWCDLDEVDPRPEAEAE